MKVFQKPSIGFLMLQCVSLAAAQLKTSMPPECSMPREGALRLNLTKDNVHWGYFWKGSRPKAYVQSGEEFTMEMATHQSGDAPELMIKGDPGMEDVYKWTADSMAISYRGATGKADGKHILTGPVFLCGAEPGDVIQIDILDMKPRKNPSTGKAYGSNGAALWGWQYKTGFQTGEKDSKLRDVATIYEIKTDADGYMTHAEPEYNFRMAPDASKGWAGYKTPACIPTTGKTPDSLPNQTYTYNSPNETFTGNVAPCINGSNTLGGYWYIGQVYQHPTGTEDYSIKGKWRVPANPHVGNMGLAYDWPAPTSSIYPGRLGGNMDHRRIGPGSSEYLPVEVNGGLFQAGDCHSTQGDSEYDGTGLETSFTGRFRLTLHKKEKVPDFIPTPMESPILENKKEICWHGFTYLDFLRDIPESILDGKDPQVAIIKAGYNTTLAMLNTGKVATRGVIQYFNVTEDAAHSIITLGCDFGITQLVDSNLGYHVCCYKYVGDKSSYGVNSCGRYNPPTFLPPSGSSCEATSELSAKDCSKDKSCAPGSTAASKSPPMPAGGRRLMVAAAFKDAMRML